MHIPSMILLSDAPPGLIILTQALFQDSLACCVIALLGTLNFGFSDGRLSIIVKASSCTHFLLLLLFLIFCIAYSTCRKILSRHIRLLPIYVLNRALCSLSNGKKIISLTYFHSYRLNR